MINDKKKIQSDKKTEQTKPVLQKKSKLDKLKSEDESLEDTKISTSTSINLSSKQTKVKKLTTETNIAITTPKNKNKVKDKKTITNKNKKVLNSSNTTNESTNNQRLTTMPSISSKLNKLNETSTPIKINIFLKKKWDKNPVQTSNILSSFCNVQQNKLNEIFSYVFSKLSELSKNIFYQNLYNLKKQTDEIITLISQSQSNTRDSNEYFDYNKIFLDFIKATTQKLEAQNESNNFEFNNSSSNFNNFNSINIPCNCSNDFNKKLSDNNLIISPLNGSENEINYLFKKNNSVSFEFPIAKKRALSSRIEKRLNRSRKSSEEIEMRIKEKMENAERRKESIKQSNIDNLNKLNEKIIEIQKKKKKEKKEMIKKIYTKLEKINTQQQQIKEKKIEICKKEHEKVNEINYLHSLIKEYKNIKIMKKLNYSIERRNKYMQERINKTLRHRRFLNKNNILGNGSSINANNNIADSLKENLTTKNDLNNNIIFNKKQYVENKISFLQKVFNENFIWELIEANYFDIDELYNLTSLTKFELVKLKLRKEKEIIDRLYSNRKNHINSNNSNNSNNPCTVSRSNNDNTNYNDTEYIYDDDLFNSFEDINENNLNMDKRSRSFTFFNENDLMYINYLFDNDSLNKKKKKKKKNRKKNKKNENDNDECNANNNLTEEDIEIRNKLMRTLNSISQKDLKVFVDNEPKETKIKKYLIKSESNSKYVQSKIIVTQEELDLNNSNNNPITKKSSTAQITIDLSEIENSSSSNVNPNTSITGNVSTSNNNTSSAKKLTTPIQNVPNSAEPLSPKKKSGGTPSNVNNTTMNMTNNSAHSSSIVNDQGDNCNSTKEKKDKIFQNLIQNTDIGNTNNNVDTIMIKNDSSLVNILEKNQITIRWCKFCNMILSNDQDSNKHINSPDHQRIVKEYGLSLQEESKAIMLFQSIPGDINEELKNERVNAIKLRVKKLKQKMSLKMVKHENTYGYKQDYPSPNKQRIQKLSFDIEKQILPNIKDYETLENLLKDLIKILEQKKQNDLHLLRQVKLIQCLVEVLKKPAVCHKSEIKSLGKIMELIIKILTFFSVLLENRNYMIITNRISVIADLLLWVLNKPTKIPLCISFLPDLISIITVHIKHRIPFEYLSMKDDTLEYIFLSNIPIKFKLKYYNLNSLIDLNSSFGSFPLVLLKSLSMFESLTLQININYLTKPVYKKHPKMSENILFMLEYSELLGLVHMLYILLLSNGPIKLTEKVVIQSQTVITASLLAVKILNNICRIDLNLVQNIISSQLNKEQMQHVISYIICYSLEFLDTSDDIKELLHETLLLIGYLCLNNDNFKSMTSKGEVTIIQHICNLPFSYFSDKQLKDILFPTLIIMTYNSERNTKILAKEINLELITMYLGDKIQLEPIIEEDMDDVSSSINNDGNNKNIIKINREQFLTTTNNINNDKNEIIIPRNVAYSTTSSTKSCHDMVTGISDYILLYHRFPFELWEKAKDYYLNFEKSNL